MWTSRPCAFGASLHGAVEDALSGQAVEALDRETPPRDAAGQDHGPGAQHVAAVEMYLAGRRIDPGDLAGH